MISKAMIQCEHISKHFIKFDRSSCWKLLFQAAQVNLDRVHVLKDLSFEVPKGKFVGILGGNGAGKSTLLRLLGGVYKHDSGIINLSAFASGVFELGGFGNGQITAAEFSKRVLAFMGVKKNQLQDLLNDIKEFSELDGNFYKKIHTFSTGMKSRLYFSVATAVQHKIYLIDEVLSVGDEHFQAKCWGRLRNRFASGASGVLVTHDWSAILKLCEQAYILENGFFRGFGPSNEVIPKYINAPKLEATSACFNFNGIYTAECYAGEDLNFQFSFKLYKKIPVSFYYTIEIFKFGIGWEILLINKESIYLTSEVGMHEANLFIPKLPLYAGVYYLNLFLISEDASVDMLELDRCSWIYGGGIKLTVIGDKSPAIVRLPLIWNEYE